MHGTLSKSNFAKLSAQLSFEMWVTSEGEKETLKTQASNTLQLYLEQDLFQSFCINLLNEQLLFIAMFTLQYKLSYFRKETKLYILSFVKLLRNFLKLILSYKHCWGFFILGYANQEITSNLI